jgi:hypothetical protein
MTGLPFGLFPRSIPATFGAALQVPEPQLRAGRLNGSRMHDMQLYPLWWVERRNAEFID